MGTVLRLDGVPVNFKHLHKNGYDPTRMVKWSEKTTGDKEIKGSLRTICFLDRIDRLAKKRFGGTLGLAVIQGPYNTTVAASAGTHDFDACVDFYFPEAESWWAMQKFARANGFGCWYRHPPLFGNHLHGFPLPPQRGVVRGDDFKDNGFKVGVYVPGQLTDYYNEAFGLANQHTPGSDKSWFPDNKKATIFNLDAYIARRAA